MDDKDWLKLTNFTKLKIGGRTDRYGPTAPLLNSFQGKSLYLFGVEGKRFHQINQVFPQTKCFSGSVSCVQVFNKGLNQAEIDLKKFCPDVNKENHVIVPCPSSYELVEGLCVKVSFTLFIFRHLCSF